jgi:transcriptional regulator with XRE-family HTH domain
MISDPIRQLRRELGRELAGWRRTAGFTQAELGRKVGYSRSTVSTVESGAQQVPREFWESCDELLGSDLAERSDRVHLAEAAEHRTVIAARRTAPPPSFDDVPAYARLGWPAEPGQDGLELVTGDVVDALELSRPAGLLAVHWWLGASANPIPGLPPLPSPSEALAVIIADTRLFFIVQSGASPWVGREHLPAAAGPAINAAAVIRWHAEGSRIPAPPGPGASWLYAPTAEFRPPSPVTLLGLLARATAAVRQNPGVLALHDGILAVPAWSQ